MTYRKLKNIINNFSDKQLNMDVTIYIEENDEYFEAAECKIYASDNDILDEGHPYLVIE
jgi:hypothetical protein